MEINRKLTFRDEKIINTKGTISNDKSKRYHFFREVDLVRSVVMTANIGIKKYESEYAEKIQAAS